MKVSGALLEALVRGRGAHAPAHTASCLRVDREDVREAAWTKARRRFVHLLGCVNALGHLYAPGSRAVPL